MYGLRERYMEWEENQEGQREAPGHPEAHDRDRVLIRAMEAGYLGEHLGLCTEARFRCLYVSSYHQAKKETTHNEYCLSATYNDHITLLLSSLSP